jgi:hypothetical protein
MCASANPISICESVQTNSRAGRHIDRLTTETALVAKGPFDRWGHPGSTKSHMMLPMISLMLRVGEQGFSVNATHQSSRFNPIRGYPRQ